MPKTILTVDDAATMRRLIAVTLRGAGHDAVEMPDGATALNYMANNSADLVISDINMPVMNGIELTRNIRRLPSHQATPILIVTTEVDARVKAQARAAGANGWIVKPFRPEQLIAAVSAVLKLDGGKRP